MQCHAMPCHAMACHVMSYHVMYVYRGKTSYRPECTIAPYSRFSHPCPLCGLKVLGGISASPGEQDVVTARVATHQGLQVVDLVVDDHVRLLAGNRYR